MFLGLPILLFSSARALHFVEDEMIKKLLEFSSPEFSDFYPINTILNDIWPMDSIAPSVNKLLRLCTFCLFFAINSKCQLLTEKSIAASDSVLQKTIS